MCSLYKPSPMNADLWSTIAQMPNLEILGFEIPPLPLSRGSLLKLRKLTLRKIIVHQFLDSLDGSALVELRLKENDDPLGVRQILRFQQLRTLQFHAKNEDLLALVTGLPQLIELQVLQTDIPDNILRVMGLCFRQTNGRLNIKYFAGHSIEFNN